MSETRIAFLDFLRSIAALMVVYCHLIGGWAQHWAPSQFVASEIEKPLGIIWHFGFIGVAVFYLISGFIISAVAERETHLTFLVKRFFRIYPTFLVALVFAFLLARITGLPSSHMTIDDFILEASLFGSSFKLLGPSYTLVIEMFFYIEVLLLLSLLKSRPMSVALGIAVMPLAVTLFLREHVLALGHPQVSLMMNYFAFTPVFAMGMVMHLMSSARIKWQNGLTILAIAWICLGVDLPLINTQGRFFCLQIAYAMVLFLLAFQAAQHLGHPVWQALANWSYSLYLLHFSLGALIISFLTPALGIGPAALAALIASLAAACLSYHVIDRPMQSLAREIVSTMHLRHVYQPSVFAEPAGKYVDPVPFVKMPPPEAAIYLTPVATRAKISPGM